MEAGDVTLEAAAEDSPLAELAWRFDFAPAVPPPFVAGYARGLPALRFLVPDGAFACVRALEALGGGRALCLFADKGPRTVAQLAALPFPPLARHGCVSAAVNFHALRAWAGWRFWCEPMTSDAAFGVYAVGRGRGRLPATRRAFDAAFGANQPLAAQAALEATAARAGSATLDELLAALEASACSPDALIRLAAPLRRCAPGSTPDQAARLTRVLERVSENHFELAEDADVAFELASVLHLARQLGPAMRQYLRSIAARGEHPTTRFNLALCCLDLGGLDEARAQLEAVLALAPGHRRAKELLSSLP